jgi:hypothetical protein
VKTVYMPAMSGDHTFVLDWVGDGDLRVNLKVKATGVWVGANTGTQHPKLLTVPLDAGVEYRVAVWAKSGSGDFTVTAYEPD